MSCTNDPLTLTVPYNQTTTLELQCTPFGNAKLTVISGSLSANTSLTFKCNDTTPRIGGALRVLSQEYQYTYPVPNLLANRKLNLTIPYDQASVSVPQNLRIWIVDPNGWIPVPGGGYIVDPNGWFPAPDSEDNPPAGVTYVERVYDDTNTRLLYAKVPSIVFKDTAGVSHNYTAGKFIVAELKP
jgi:hypothetical protein